MLEDQPNYTVATAQGGKEGWEAIQATRPDVVILDLFMPGMNGFDVLAKIRSDADLRGIPVIVLTGADLSPEQHQLLTEFGQNVLTKSFLRENELLVELEAALRTFQTADKPAQ